MILMTQLGQILDRDEHFNLIANITSGQISSLANYKIESHL